ncbi:MAG: hypothetical protein N3G48_03635 [Sulfolobales archaeon]|nr:hypothetical protein [Sulfolobales archaeon]MCX8186187.1 hypothetical protein [Sulfolobales archaeon]
MNVNNLPLLVSRVKLLLYIALYSFLCVGLVLLSFSVVIIITTSVLSMTNLFGFELLDLPRIVYLMLSGVISVYGYIEVGDMINALDSGRFEGLKETLIIWGFLGLVFGLVLPGLTILIVLVRYYGMLIKATAVK